MSVPPPGRSSEGAAEAAAPSRTDADRAELLHRRRDLLRSGIEKVVVGQHRVVEELLVALFGGGHAILVGVPGLAKTLLVNTLARLLGLRFRRIQFTPDLMPSDVTGTDVIQEDPETGRRGFHFLEGPIFTNLLLADEINRTPPKTQAALLEAMQERHVTVGQRTIALPEPFFVVATQNPIEQEGTYRLPEAQLDRFLLSIRVGYPSEDEELEIIRRTREAERVPLEPVLSREELLEVQELVPRVPASDDVCRYALRIARATRPGEDAAPGLVRECVAWGAGPRAAQALVLAAKARALLEGELHVRAADVRAVAQPVLAHRIVTNFHAGAEGVTAEGILERILHDVRAPRGAS